MLGPVTRRLIRATLRTRAQAHTRIQDQLEQLRLSTRSELEDQTRQLCGDGWQPLDEYLRARPPTAIRGGLRYDVPPPPSPPDPVTYTDVLWWALARLRTVPLSSVLPQLEQMALMTDREVADAVRSHRG